MSPERHEQIKRMFLAACDLEPAARGAFLQQACHGDPDLMAEVSSLLKFHYPDTILEEASADVPAHELGSATDAASHPPTRYVPGTIIAGRYRIVNLLGRGGMGEVYRADDLKLQRPVALKFILEGRAEDGAWLARFYREARLALRITHPNICRVYDIGEAAGEAFISMEYIDGEDLASLLRRIGRLTRGKMLDVTRQLCAGLASAHAQGVLHRDLKPANVMIDGQGRVRITDFGIAVEATTERQMAAGSPSYMAPEVLTGRPATVRSDLYALGLIMYEMSTGVRAFAENPLDLADRAAPAPPSSVDPEIDATIERVILRCIQVNPEERPHSAEEIAVSLPGGDRLIAAIKAGETPSPEMVAAAGQDGRLSPRIAIALSALAVAGLAAVVLLADRTLLLSAQGLPKSPHVLEDRAREIVRQLGGSSKGLRMRSGFALAYAADIRTGPASMAVRPGEDSGLLGPPCIVFEYFQAGDKPISTLLESRREPYAGSAVQTLVRMDPAGRLLFYFSVPKSMPPVGTMEAEHDWSVPAEFAGIPYAGLKPVAASSPPPAFADMVRAWEGPSGFDSGLNVRVQGASLAGRTIYYEVTRVPVAESSLHESRPLAWQRPRLAFEMVSALTLVSLTGGLVLARRNLRLGRGDRRGAWRTALFLFGLEVSIWVVSHEFSRSLLAETREFLRAIQLGLFVGAGAWVLYIGLEPYVRRLWPRSIISWSRLMAGRVNDPLIGRDVLVGVAFATGIILLQQMNVLLLPEQRVPPQMLQPGSYWSLGQLLGFQHTFGVLAKGVRIAVLLAMVFLMLMLLLRLALRIPLLAGIVFFCAVSLVYVLGSPLLSVSSWITCGLTVAGTAILLLHFGFLATVTNLLSIRLLLGNPLTADTDAWCAGSTAFVLLTLLALLAFGLFTSLNRSPVQSTLTIPS